MAEMDLDSFFRVLFGHSAFQYLRAGAKLGVFDALHETPQASEEDLAHRLGLSREAADVLICGLVSISLVERQGSALVNARVIEALIEDGRWPTILKWIRFEGDIVYPGQARFAESLKSGHNEGLSTFPGSGSTLYQRLEEDAEASRVFFEYMSAWSEVAGGLLMANVDMSYGKVLDVGGGDGTLAAVLASKVDGCVVTLLDLPHVCEATQAKLGGRYSHQIEFSPCDFIDTDWPGGFDTVLLAHQLVIWPEEVNQKILRKAYGALRPGGKVLIVNSLMEEAGSEPFLSVMDVPYFVSVPSHGRIYRWSDYGRWLAEAGFSLIQNIRPEGAWTPHGIILAEK